MSIIKQFKMFGAQMLKEKIADLVLHIIVIFIALYIFVMPYLNQGDFVLPLETVFIGVFIYAVIVSVVLLALEIVLEKVFK